MFEHLNLDIQLLWQGKYLATPLFRLWNVLQLKMISIIMEVELSQLITLGLNLICYWQLMLMISCAKNMSSRAMLSLLELTQSRKCKMLQCCDEYQILKIAVLINPLSSNNERNPASQKLVTYVAWKCVNSRKHFFHLWNQFDVGSEGKKRGKKKGDLTPSLSFQLVCHKGNPSYIW